MKLKRPIYSTSKKDISLEGNIIALYLVGVLIKNDIVYYESFIRNYPAAIKKYNEPIESKEAICKYALSVLRELKFEMAEDEKNNIKHEAQLKKYGIIN